MGTLEDRFYDTTIPEHGPSPRIGMVTMRVSVVMDWRSGDAVITVDGGWYGRIVNRQPLPTALVAAKRGEVMQSIDRRCAGMRRRQARRR